MRYPVVGCDNVNIWQNAVMLQISAHPPAWAQSNVVPPMGPFSQDYGIATPCWVVWVIPLLHVLVLF